VSSSPPGPRADPRSGEVTEIRYRDPDPRDTRVRSAGRLMTSSGAAGNRIGW
jgi:hypothetical protein